MTTEQIQSEFANTIAVRIGREDDPEFWSTVFGTLLRDFELQHFNQAKKKEIFLQIGSCSHWLRPHQTQLTADGGFAFPSGYLGGSGFSVNGLPEFDWYLILHRNQDTGQWVLSEKSSLVNANWFVALHFQRERYFINRPPFILCGRWYSASANEETQDVLRLPKAW
jgi:hypothetical protein